MFPLNSGYPARSTTSGNLHGGVSKENFVSSIVQDNVRNALCRFEGWWKRRLLGRQWWAIGLLGIRQQVHSSW